MAGETIEKFDGNVKMAEALASLAFMRAVDSESGRSELEPKDAAELLKVAGNLVKLSAEMKRQRLEIIDQFEHVSDAPKPANIGYIVVEAGVPEQIRRFVALNMMYEAELLAKQNDLDINDFTQTVEVMETPA